MELTTVERPANAEEMLGYYLDLSEADRTPVDVAMIDLLKSLDDDAKVIDVEASLRAGGADENGRPALALARADWETCYLEHNRWRTRYAHAYWPRGNAQTFVYDHLVEVEAGYGKTMAAMVPPIPPMARPKRWRLRKYLILWEATWAEAPQPPGDPALLRPIGGGIIAGRLAVVEHVWDPTPLELLVLGMRS
jgi:hypothetical protein